MRCRWWYAIALVALVPCTLLALPLRFKEKELEVWKVGLYWKWYYDGLTVSYESLIDRKKAGYEGLPEYYNLPRGKKKGWRPAYFLPYRERMGEVGPVEYYVADKAHWPDGDPGLALNNPAPPLVKRTRVFYLGQHLFGWMAAAGWVGYLIGAGALWRRSRGIRKGFEVVGVLEKEGLDGKGKIVPL